MIKRIHKCKTCEETNPNEFYGHMKSMCRKCHTKYTLNRGWNNREYAFEILGKKCQRCGYNEFLSGLSIHHIDPNKKDRNYESMRTWGKPRIQRELKNCICLCHNCHLSFHKGDWK